MSNNSAVPSNPNLSSVLGHADTLSERDTADYSAFESQIRKGWDSFVDVGNALAEIRDRRLYRAEFSTFEEYYRARWHFEHAKVYRLISAAQFVTTLSVIPGLPRPDHEAQIRPLFGLPMDQALSAWQHAADIAQGRKITARLVKAALQALNLGVPAVSGQVTVREERSQRRRLFVEATSELVNLIVQKAPHELLLSKAERLQQQLSLLFTRQSPT